MNSDSFEWNVDLKLSPAAAVGASTEPLIWNSAKDFHGPRLIAETDTALPDGGGGKPGFGYRLGAGYGREFSLGGAHSELTLGLEYYKNEGPN